MSISLSSMSLPAREGQAAGISAMEHGTEFLKKHDLLSEKPYAVSCPGVQILDKNARVRMKVARPLTMTSWNVLYYRFRANFDGMKSEHCPEVPSPSSLDGTAIYEHGKRVTSVKQVDGELLVEFADGAGGGILKPNLVIVADGSTSSIRQLLQPDLERKYAGYAIWRGTVPENEVSEATQNLLATHMLEQVMVYCAMCKV